MNTHSDLEILLIEDSEFDAELTIWSLKKVNLANKLIHLKDGQQALDFIFCKGEYSNRVKTQTPKVILLDIKMPKVSGIEVLRQLKADPVTQNIPVVIMTSSKEDTDILNSYKLGVNSYVVKPVDFEKFSKAVSELGMYWVLTNQSPV